MRHLSCRPQSRRPIWPSLRLGLCWLLVATLTAGCAYGPPAGVTAVSSFDAQRYTGKWYEIARLDHGFERGLTDINATYRLLPDGSLEVTNRGYDPKEKTWQQAVGHARFLGDPRKGSLKVSFFGPFYGGYHVVALDRKGYDWALVMGPDRDYFWILARDKQLPEPLRQALLENARRLGIDTGLLIWPSQTRDDS